MEAQGQAVETSRDMNLASHSKVIVHFNDPAALFDDVSPHIRKRLPLGNLHWKSPNRPLRAIGELDVSLDREDTTSSTHSNSTIRRHQIPGLRQTPFVKVLLLRCDDKDQYKDQVRKQVKDWVKGLGVSTSGKATTKGQERHDAYEYMIVHVVVPGTAAANQAKSSKHFSVDATDSTDSVNSKSKWPGKSNSTVFDKLKADFASSSKAPFERVTQVRLVDPAKPSNSLGPLEIEEQWQELVDKLKSAILLSFDARVAQYEEDIRERENQRSLPGWNFCTFFILKEGLARGFENVGLLEDALQIYEELDAGLDAVVQDQAKADYNDATNALLPFSADLKDVIRSALTPAAEDDDVSNADYKTITLDSWVSLEKPNFPWRLDRRNYQQMILTNQISALDFRIYIFIRQSQVMLRRAASTGVRSKFKSVGSDSEQIWDADILSEICRRSIAFLNLAARNLRQDLYAAWGGQEGLPTDELMIQDLVIGNLVASWRWACLLQILNDCQIIKCFVGVTNIEAGDSSVRNLSKSQGTGQANSPPNHDEASTSFNKTEPNLANELDSDFFSKLRVVRGNKADLIFQAGEIYMMLRTILLQHCQHNKMLSDLTSGIFPATPAVNSSKNPWTGVKALSLRGALLDQERARHAYRLLAFCASKCYIGAGKRRASRQLLFDLAKLEAHSGDFDAALIWLDQDSTLLDCLPQNQTDRSILQLYIDCLRKAAPGQRLLQALLLSLRAMPIEMPDQRTGQDHWEEILRLGQSTNIAAIPLEELFWIKDLEGHISHDHAQDYTRLNVCLQSSLPVTNLGLAKVVLRCESSRHPSSQEIHFHCSQEIFIRDRCASLQLCTTVITEGWYQPKTLEISFGDLAFSGNVSSPVQEQARDNKISACSQRIPQAVYLYPNVEAPTMKALHAPHIEMAKKRSINVSVFWGMRQINGAQLRLRPATAGFRLDLVSEKTLNGPAFTRVTTNDSIHLVCAEVELDSESVIQIPYTLDDPNTLSVAIRAELQYDNEFGHFEISDTLHCMSLLPISVNVQDICQAGVSFARFTIGPSRLIPLSVLGCEVSNVTKSTTAPRASFEWPLEAYPQQPVSWIVAIDGDATTKAENQEIDIMVSYQCLDEIIMETLTETFAKSMRDTIFKPFLRPCLRHLEEQVQTLWTENDIELATLTGEMYVWGFDELKWSELTQAFRKSDRDGLERWLRRWHEETTLLSLHHSLAPMRSLSVRAPAPQTNIVITTKVTLQLSCLIVGQPVPAKFDISVASLSPNIETAVEILSSEAWLVGGQRKITLSSATAQSTVILVAQTDGDIVLPAIDVSCIDTANGGRQVPFELDNLNAATTIKAISGKSSSTFGISNADENERDDRRHWLVET